MSKGLEALNIIITRLHPSSDNVAKATHEIKIIEKELKALEIIIKKQVDIKTLIDINLDYEWYQIIVERDKWDYTYVLTKEEFDLLKEVLL